MRRLARRAGLAVNAARQGGALAAFVIDPGEASLRRLVEACAGADGLATRKLAQALGSSSEETLPREWAARLQEAFCFALPPLPFEACRGALEDLARECAAAAPEAAAAAEALLAAEAEPEPAVGSVAQVYFHGRIALKVLRQGVEEELELLRALARFAAPPLMAVGRRDAAALVRQAAKDLEAQTDLREELERLQEVEDFLSATGCRCVLAPRGVCATREVLVMTRVPSLQFHPDGSATTTGGAGGAGGAGGVGIPEASLEELRWRTDVAAVLFFVTSAIEGHLLHADLHPANYGCPTEASPLTEGLVVYDLGACVAVGDGNVSELILCLLEERWSEAARLCLQQEPPGSAEEALDAVPKSVVDGKSFRSWLQRLQRKYTELRPVDCMCRCSVGIAHFLGISDSIGYAHISDTGMEAVEAAARAAGVEVALVRAHFRRLHTLVFLGALGQECADDGLRGALERLLARLAEGAAAAELALFYEELAPLLWKNSLRAGRFDEEAYERFLPLAVESCRITAQHRVLCAA
jgi:hypothetical protein